MHLDLDLYRNDYIYKIWFFIWSSRVRCQTWRNKQQVSGVNTSKTLVRLKALRFLWNLARSLLNFGSEIVFWAFLGKLPTPIKSFKLYLDIYDNHKSLKGGLSDKKKKKHRSRRNVRRTMSVGEIIMRSRWSSNVKKNMKTHQWRFHLHGLQARYQSHSGCTWTFIWGKRRRVWSQQ